MCIALRQNESGVYEVKSKYCIRFIFNRVYAKHIVSTQS